MQRTGGAETRRSWNAAGWRGGAPPPGDTASPVKPSPANPGRNGWMGGRPPPQHPPDAGVTREKWVDKCPPHPPGVSTGESRRRLPADAGYSMYMWAGGPPWYPA